MKRVIIFLLVLNIFQSCSKHEPKKVDSKTDVVIDFSGEYSGTFTDLKNMEGKIELSLYQSKNGLTGGIITLKKKSTEDKLITGTINVTGDGKIINGYFTPSVIDHTVLYPDKNLVLVDSYQCSWNFYGEIKDESGNLITGKAVPVSCSESNLMEFTLVRNK